MIKGKGVTFLDGDFKKEHPTHTQRSFRDDKGKWHIAKCGPEYMNHYEVTSYDDEGEKWLIEHSQERQ